MSNILKRASVKGSLVAAALTLNYAHAAQVPNNTSWYADQSLNAEVADSIEYDWDAFEWGLAGTLSNQSTFKSTGAHRVVIKTYRDVTNADGYTEEGYPYINICSDCTLSPNAKKSFSFSYPVRFWDFFFGITMPELVAENVPYQLQLLHNADMDGVAGALQNVKPFSAIVSALRAQHPQNTLLLSSGDNYIPGPRFAAAKDAKLNPLLGVAGEGRGDIAFMNAMGYQASAVGNHDLDAGTKGFAAIINNQTGETGVYAGAKFPYLSSNLDFSTDENLNPLIKQDNLSPEQMINSVAKSTIIEVAGQRIGVVGATTPKLAEITKTDGITVNPSNGDDIPALAAQIQKAVDVLTQQGVNKVVLLAHMQQISIEKQLATLLKDVDIIVAGGSNTLLADANDELLTGDTAADKYPLAFKGADKKNVLVVNTDGDYKYLGRLMSQFTIDGEIITERLDDKVNGVYAAKDSVLAALGNPAVNAEVEMVADALSSVLAASDGNIQGKSAVYLDGRRKQVRSQETNMGNLTADANLWYAKNTDNSIQVSLKNGGGIRDDIGYFAFPPGSTNADDLKFFPTAPNPAAGKKAGDISEFDIKTSLRFNNGLTALTVTAEELLSLLNHAVARAGQFKGEFPQVAGMKFSFDPSKPVGQKVQSFVIVNNGTVVDRVARNGQLLGDASRTIRMVTLGFLAGGGDGYPFPDLSLERVNAVQLKKADSEPKTGLSTFAVDGSEQDALAEFLQTFHKETPFNIAETPVEKDERIQNLSKRSDSL